MLEATLNLDKVVPLGIVATKMILHTFHVLQIRFRLMQGLITLLNFLWFWKLDEGVSIDHKSVTR